jgi:hypothetical protein
VALRTKKGVATAASTGTKKSASRCQSDPEETWLVDGVNGKGKE